MTPWLVVGWGIIASRSQWLVSAMKVLPFLFLQEKSLCNGLMREASSLQHGHASSW